MSSKKRPRSERPRKRIRGKGRKKVATATKEVDDILTCEKVRLGAQQVARLHEIRQELVARVARRLQDEGHFTETVLGADDPSVEADGGDPGGVQAGYEGDGGPSPNGRVGDEAEGLVE